jgi:hypothetical protein
VQVRLVILPVRNCVWVVSTRRRGRIDKTKWVKYISKERMTHKIERLLCTVERGKRLEGMRGRRAM